MKTKGFPLLETYTRDRNVCPGCPLAFWYLIPMIWRPCDLNLVMISSVASKCQDFKVGMPVFQPQIVLNVKTKTKCASDKDLPVHR